MRILLHVCCGPCALNPLETLQIEGRILTGFWYNPNIHPYSEYQRRLMTAGFLFQRLGISLAIQEADFPGFLTGLVEAQNRGERCIYCYQERLRNTATAAKKGGYDSFSTTLLASRRQPHEKVRELGVEIGKEVGIPFLYRDFRSFGEDFRRKIQRWGIYHQNYCGCIYSEWERTVGKRVADETPERKR